MQYISRSEKEKKLEDESAPMKTYVISCVCRRHVRGACSQVCSEKCSCRTRVLRVNALPAPRV